MIELAGRRFDVVCHDSTDLDHVLTFFGAADHRVDGEPDGHIRVAPIARPARAASSANGPIERWDDGTDVTLWHDNGRGALVTQDTIVIGEAPPNGRQRWRTVRQLLTDSMSAWFARHEALLVHGGVVGRAGRSLLLVGPTGAGKSSAVVAALRLGVDVYTDDLAVVRRGRELDCDGVPKPVMIERSLAHELGGLASTSSPVDVDDDRDRVVLGREALATGTTTVSAIVAIGHSAGDAYLEELDHISALSLVANSSYEVAHGGTALVLPLLARLGSLPSWRLALDTEPEHRIERACDLLSEIFDASRG